MKIKLDTKAIMPTRAHKTDAGLDLYSPDAYVIPPGERCVISTGVHVQLPHDTVGMLKSKSGLNVFYGLLNEGVIDEGYTGEIGVCIYNHSHDTFSVQRGDKISQLVILPCLRPDLKVVDKLDETERGNDGFGSTGPRANMRDEYVRGFIRCKDCEYCIQIHSQYDPLDIKFGCIKGRRDKTDELFDDLGCIEGYLAFGRKEK